MDEFWKIGSSDSPLRRLAQLQGLPYPVSLVHSFPSVCAGMVEMALHWRFTERRVRGEWFRLTSEDVQAICSVVACDSPKQLPAGLYRRGLSGPFHQARVEPAVLRVITTLAGNHGRSITEEATLALIAWAQAKGKWPPTAE